MAQRITVEGTITPSVLLSTGEQMTVTRSPFIDKLISKGFIRVVADDAPTPTQPAVEDQPVVVVPARNAKREVWAAFLTNLKIEFSDEDGRDELINLYEDSEHYVPDDDRG
ncbi:MULTISPECIES: hypothetical protein [Rhodococcus]|uniref:hypothetical protein n=1 Tax=Rhodococcus TaxID=1827 RepID=UPI000C7D5775|nr:MULTISPECIES: hypothetical protein [Rhodococcus]AUM17362.1 hypothetical protein CSW53_13060 [Rhodococcus ruber]